MRIPTKTTFFHLLTQTCDDVNFIIKVTEATTIEDWRRCDADGQQSIYYFFSRVKAVREHPEMLIHPLIIEQLNTYEVMKKNLVLNLFLDHKYAEILFLLTFLD